MRISRLIFACLIAAVAGALTGCDGSGDASVTEIVADGTTKAAPRQDAATAFDPTGTWELTASDTVTIAPPTDLSGRLVASFDPVRSTLKVVETLADTVRGSVAKIDSDGIGVISLPGGSAAYDDGQGNTCSVVFTEAIRWRIDEMAATFSARQLVSVELSESAPGFCLASLEADTAADSDARLGFLRELLAAESDPAPTMELAVDYSAKRI